MLKILTAIGILFVAVVFMWILEKAITSMIFRRILNKSLR
jgi:hypothetical protein